MSFEPLDPTYFNKYPDLDAIFGMALTYVYPTMISSNIDDVTLYATGFDKSESYLQGFKEGTIGMMTCSNPEALIYPVALIANAVKGTQFDDMPAEAERVETNTVFLTNETELNVFKENAVFYTADTSNSLLTDDDIRSLIKPLNKDASYENLVNTIQQWSIEDIMEK